MIWLATVRMIRRLEKRRATAKKKKVHSRKAPPILLLARGFFVGHSTPITDHSLPITSQQVLNLPISALLAQNQATGAGITPIPVRAQIRTPSFDADWNKGMIHV